MHLLAIRIPAFPGWIKSNHSRQFDINRTIDTENLLPLLKLASSSFYRQALDDPQNPAVHEKIQKYSRRASHRCVPFGGFTSIVTVGPNSDAKNSSFQLSDEQLVSNTSGEAIESLRITDIEEDVFDTTIFGVAEVFALGELSGGLYRDHASQQGKLRELLQTDRLMEVITKRVWTGTDLKKYVREVDEGLLKNGLFVSIPDKSQDILSIRADEFVSELNSKVDPKQHITNRHARISKNPISTHTLESCSKRVQKLVSLTTYDNPAYDTAKRIFADVFVEGPTELSVFESALNVHWQYYHGARTLPNIAEFESLLERQHDIFDPTNSGVELETVVKTKNIDPTEYSGSALVIFGEENTTSQTLNINDVRLGTGVEFLGRFYGENINLDQKIDEIAINYEKSTPRRNTVEVIFRHDATTYNVTNRHKIFSQRLVIGDRFDVFSNGDLGISDVAVAMIQNELIFFNNKTGDKLDLVFPHCANFSHSKFPLIVQVLYACANKSVSGFRWPRNFIDRLFLPRIILDERTWVSPAKWKLSSDQRIQLKKMEGTKADEWLQGWADQKMGLIKMEIANGDRALVVDLNDKLDRKIASQELRKPGTYLQECFNSIHLNTLFGQGNEIFNHQAVVSFTSKIEPPKGIDRISTTSQYRKTLEDFALSWLNYEIFCSKENSEAILIHYIYPTISRLRELGELKRWFFIRYSQLGDHLRIRLECNKPEIRSDVSETFENLLILLSCENVITTWQKKPFLGEFFRYGQQNFDSYLSEFCKESEELLNYFQRVKSMSFGSRQFSDLLTLSKKVHGVFESNRTTIVDRIRLIDKIVPSGKINFDQTKKLENAIFEFLQYQSGKRTTLTQRTSQDSEILSLIHMSANRLFYKWTREQEWLSFRSLGRAYRRQMKNPLADNKQDKLDVAEHS